MTVCLTGATNSLRVSKYFITDAHTSLHACGCSELEPTESGNDDGRYDDLEMIEAGTRG